MNEPYSLVSLSEILTKSREQVEIDHLQRYKQVTIKLWGQGVVLRNEVAGAEIASARRFVVRPQQFILSRIDARNGAFGILPDFLDGAVVSNDFPTFTLNPARILPAFLGWMSKTRGFVDLCRAASEGTTNRVRLKEDRFLAMKIPLPPLAEQRRTVVGIEELAAKIEVARGLRRQAIEESDLLLTSTLNSIFDIETAPHPIQKLGDLCKTTSGGTPSRDRADYYSGHIPWVKSGELEDGFITRSEEHISETALAASSAKLFPSGTLLVALYGATTGKTGVIKIDAATNQAICAVFPQDSLQRDYVWWFLRYIRPQYLASSFGGAQPNISQKTLRNTRLPVPSPFEQLRIVDYLNTLQDKVHALEQMQTATSFELDALLPSVLDKVFNGKL